MQDKDVIIGHLNNTNVLENAAIYYDERIAVIENIQNTNITQPIWMKATSVIMCRKGKGSIYIDNTLYNINENDILLCRPNTILEHGLVSIDFECYGFLLSPQYIGQLFLIPSGWDAALFLKDNPVLSLNEKETQTFRQYYELIRNKLTGAPQIHKKELIDALLQAFIYEFHDSLERFVKLKQPSYSSAETLFKSFMNLLTSSYPKERTVLFYADKLCVTPKYLSHICKTIIQHTASELINHYVIQDVKYILKRTDKSIKEITNELNFPNISFFGKYTKRHLGMSPKQYRAQGFPNDTPSQEL